MARRLCSAIAAFSFLFRFFDDGINNVGLAALFDLAARGFPYAGEFGFIAPACVDGTAAGWKFVDHGEIEIAVERERESARDGSGGHHEDVRRRAFFHEAFALQDAEAVLFIDDDEARVS